MPLAKRRPLTTMAGAAVVALVAWLPAGPALAASGPARFPAPTHAQPVNSRVVVTFAWGGGLGDQMRSLQVFREYGMRATYFIPSGLICILSQSQCEKSRYLTIPDIREMAAYGNEIGGLGVSHQPLTTMPVAEAMREICDDRSNLFRLGFHATDFAYPYALVSPTVEALTRACGYNAGLGTGTLKGAGLCDKCAVAETIPPKDPYNVRTPVEVNSVRTIWTLGTFQSIVTDAQRHGGGWIVFTLHDICQASCSFGTTPAILTAVLKWLRGQRSHNVVVETMREVIGGPVRPAMAGPAPLALPAAGVANADLAQVSGGLPECFQMAAYGGTVANPSYQPHGGPHGSAAETVRVTKAQAGNAKLVQAMDLGLCAPPVTSGSAYTAGVWYKSSRPTRIDVYRRTSLGGWSYWTTSSVFPASASWRQASWTTPAVPPDTTALSFGLTTNGVGMVSTSDYSLQLAKSYRIMIILGIVLFAIVAASLITRGHYRYLKAEAADAEAEAALAKVEAAAARAELAKSQGQPAMALTESAHAQAAIQRAQAEPAAAQTKPASAQLHVTHLDGRIRRPGRSELTHPGRAATQIGRGRIPPLRPRLAEGIPRLACRDAAFPQVGRGMLIQLYEEKGLLPLQSWLVDARRLLLVEDFRMVTQALASRLAAAADLWVAGCCTGDDPKLPEVVCWLRPDVIVIEVEPLGFAVGEVVKRLLAAWPPARVVVVSADHNVAHAVDAARAGAAAWVANEQAADELETVLRAVCQGHSWFPPETLGPILRELRGDARKTIEDSDPLKVLSRRERDVLASMAEGKRAPDIAEELLISIDTVRAHTRSIFSKLDVHSRPEAVRVARAAGLRPPDRPAISGGGTPAAVPIRPRGRAGVDRTPARLRSAGSGSAVQALSQPQGARPRNQRRGKAAAVKAEGEASG